MNKNEFLNKLDKALRGIPFEDRKDILCDYEEHFSIGLEEGKSEEDVAKALGDPSTIARLFKADYMIKKAEGSATVTNIFRVILSTIGLGMLNLVFLVPLYCGLLAILLSLFLTSAALSLGGIAGLLTILGVPFFADYVSLPPVNIPANVFLSLGLIPLGTLMFIGLLKLSGALFRWSVKYAKFNLSLINRKQEG